MVFLRGMFELLRNRLVAFFLRNPGEPLQDRMECSVWDRYIVGELGAQLQWCLTSVAPATMSMFLLFALCQLTKDGRTGPCVCFRQMSEIFLCAFVEPSV